MWNITVITHLKVITCGNLSSFLCTHTGLQCQICILAWVSSLKMLESHWSRQCSTNHLSSLNFLLQFIGLEQWDMNRKEWKGKRHLSSPWQWTMIQLHNIVGASSLFGIHGFCDFYRKSKAPLTFLFVLPLAIWRMFRITHICSTCRSDQNQGKNTFFSFLEISNKPLFNNLRQ